MTARLLISCDVPNCGQYVASGTPFTVGVISPATRRNWMKEDGWSITSVPNPFWEEGKRGERKRLNLDRCPDHAHVRLQCIIIGANTYRIEEKAAKRSAPR